MGKKQKIELLLEKETHYPKPSIAGGILSYEVWGFKEGPNDVVTRYNLAYINFEIYAGDNGRVLGYDNAHGYHHKHYLGKIEKVFFQSYQDTFNKFQEEWWTIVKKYGKK